MMAFSQIWEPIRGGQELSKSSVHCFQSNNVGLGLNMKNSRRGSRLGEWSKEQELQASIVDGIAETMFRHRYVYNLSPTSGWN